MNCADLWTKFQEAQKKGGNGDFLKFTSTHPSHGDRVLHVKGIFLPSLPFFFILLVVLCFVYTLAELLPQAYEARKESHCETFTEKMKGNLKYAKKKF